MVKIHLVTQWSKHFRNQLILVAKFIVNKSKRTFWFVNERQENRFKKTIKISFSIWQLGYIGPCNFKWSTKKQFLIAFCK